MIDKAIYDYEALVYRNQKNYPIDAAQTHVDVYNGDGTYSGVNANKKNRDFGEYSLNKVTGVDYVIMNTESNVMDGGN